MNRYTLVCFLALVAIIPGKVDAQSPVYSKMSPLVRQAARERLASQGAKSHIEGEAREERCLTAFIRHDGPADELLGDYGLKMLASFDGLVIAQMPLSAIAPLSADSRVKRIEAGRRARALMDTVVVCTDIKPIHEGLEPLDQTFTGRGVIVGCMDLGFDLTHPNFYSPDMSEYRIKSYWDQLSPDTVGSRMIVGRDYTTEEEICALGSSTDGTLSSHGTHTAGTAAGGGYTTPYRGVAYEADICLVTNVLQDNSELVDSADTYKYTTATDALGLKYIFDYADEQGKPCVISLSQGMYEDLAGDSKLYEDFVDSLSGPGRIVVVAAGNNGNYTQYFHKPAGEERMGAISYNAGQDIYAVLRCNNAEPFTIRISVCKASGDEIVEADTLELSSDLALLSADSVYYDYMQTRQGDCCVAIAGYPSCQGDGSEAYELLIYDTTIPSSVYTIVEIIGEEADVEYILQGGTILTNRFGLDLTSGEQGHNLFAPSTAREAICVGASAYRTGVWLLSGTYYENDQGTGGARVSFSSMGPTIDGRTKPDVMAPGVNVVSSYSHYWPKTPDKVQVATTQWQGTTYSWNADSGTSMAAPVVAGIVALWLEANPELTSQDIRDVFGRTCLRPDEGLTYPNTTYGYGNIDAYAGLLDILGLTASIDGLTADKTSATLWIEGDYLCVSLPDRENKKEPVLLSVYSVDGRILLSETIAPEADECRLSIAHLPRAIYLVRLSGQAAAGGSALFRR